MIPRLDLEEVRLNQADESMTTVGSGLSEPLPVLPCNDDNELGVEERTGPPTTLKPKKPKKGLKKMWKSIKKGLRIKSNKSKSGKTVFPLQPNADDALQQETPNTSDSNSINSNTGEGKKPKKGLKKMWKSIKKGLRIKSNKSKSGKTILPLQSNADDALQQETPNNSDTNSINSNTGEGKKPKKGLKKGLKKIVTSASKLADKLMDGMCMPRARSDSRSHRHPQEEVAAQPASPTIKAIRADAIVTETANAKSETDSDSKLKTKIKDVTKTLQWKTPVEKMKGVSLCLPCISGAATMTKA
jgi:hypothetical protein